MSQRSLIFTVSAIALLGMLLMFPHSRRAGVSMAMGDMQMALEHVNTWHLWGWKRVDAKKVPWEVWGSRNPFFYHERAGEEETLDNGQERTIVVPPRYGMKGVVIIVPSRPDAQSNVGLAFLLGLNERNAHLPDTLRESDADTRTYAVERYTSFGAPTTTRVDALYTFPNDSPLPVRYEQLDRRYRATKDAHGGIEIYDLQEEAKEKEWISAHLEAQYEVPLAAAARYIFHRPADYRTIHAVQDAARGDIPRQNAVSQNGLTLHAADIRMDAHGNMLLRIEGYIGDVNFASQVLPLSFMADTNFTAVSPAASPLGDYGMITGQRQFECRDDRNRPYIRVGDISFFGNMGAIAWMGLTPLEPLKPGEPLPRSITFPFRISVDTANVVPEMGSAELVVLVQEAMEMTVDLPGKTATIDLKSLTRQYGFDNDQFVSPFAQRASIARANTWLDMATKALANAGRPVPVAGINTRKFIIDPEKRLEAERELQRAAYFTSEAIKAAPSERAALTNHLDSIRKRFAQEGGAN